MLLNWGPGARVCRPRVQSGFRRGWMIGTAIRIADDMFVDGPLRPSLRVRRPLLRCFVEGISVRVGVG